MTSLRMDYRFTKGEWLESEPPEWFKVNNDDDWGAQLTRVGATRVDEFESDSGVAIAIYEGPAGGYVVIFWDAAKCIARVFIDNVADYLTFKAQVIAPQAMLIMESERQFERQQRRAELHPVN